MTTVHAVFEGGGVRGIALAGAAAAALDRGLAFDRVAGTSAGGLVAALVAAGYDADELSEFVCRVDWPGLLDPVPGRRLPLIGSHLALILSRGLYRGDRLEAVWRDLLRRRGIDTFADLAEGRLRVVATDLNHHAGVVLPDDLPSYGVDPDRFPVARALRMSAAVPFLFRPVALSNRTNGERVLFGDGAMATNFPAGLVPRDRPVLGFRLVADTTRHPHVEVRGPASLARAVVLSGIRARYGLPAYREFDGVTIDVPVSTDLDFDLAPQQARQVFDRGRDAAGRRLDEVGRLLPAS